MHETAVYICLDLQIFCGEVICSRVTMLHCKLTIFVLYKHNIAL